MNEERLSASPLPTGRFESRQMFTDLVRQALDCAAQDGWPLVILSDPDFAEWPLGEREVVEALQRWAVRGRQLKFLARDFSAMRQLHPRLVRWRVTWSHLIEAHACPGAAGSELPSAIWSACWTMERLDPMRGTVVASADAKRRTALKERLDSTWHKGTPSFAATTLGL
jgi:hypothetical protein